MGGTKRQLMRRLKNITAAVVALSVLAGPLTVLGADQKPSVKPRPYPLKTCIISGDKLGEMDKPYVFVYKGQEIKLCCKNCLKDFNKDPQKYIKKIAEEKAKADKKAAKTKGA
jgi:YHS domain-containing protein